MSDVCEKFDLHPLRALAAWFGLSLEPDHILPHSYPLYSQ
jgi:hypothetical protein